MARPPEGIAWPVTGALVHAQESDPRPPLAAYIHIPFCTVRCGYCDFNTYTVGFGEGADLATYSDSVIREIEMSARVLADSGRAGRPLASIFFGGGTPSLMEPADLASIMKRLGDTHGITPDAEVTLEANPETVDKVRMRDYREAGITRVSIGMQSAVPRVLATLDRTHNPANVGRAVEAARDAGCQVSVDLIYGAPGETMADWDTSVKTAIALAPDHISAYSLIIEEGTKMGRQLARGEIPTSDPDLDAEKYERADALLEQAGFEWYEISNFSSSLDTRSTHNLAYWRNWDWWGYGPGAHSHVGATRWWNVKHPRAYAGRLRADLSPGYQGETLTEEDRRVEAVMLGIRTREGLGLESSSCAIAADLVANGLLEESAFRDGRLILTLRGRLLADLVTRRLLAWE